MNIGYARISTPDQSLSLQTDALTEAGCDRIFSDVASGAKANRPGLHDALTSLREGDTLVIWRLDRLGRTTSELLAIVADLEKRGIHLQSLRETIDTSSSVGKLVFHIFSGLAEFERDLIQERTRAGLASALARGRKGGRPAKLTPEQRRIALELHSSRNYTVKQICDTLGGISDATLYRCLEKERARQAEKDASQADKTV